MVNEGLYFNKLLDIIYKKLGLNCRQYNEAYIKRRINARMMANEIAQNDYLAYIKVVETSIEELRDLFDALTINVTKFFRDPKLWKILKNNIFPKAINEKRLKFEKAFTIWSCGCSSGEEPYSLAVLMKELIRAIDVSAKITATDIDELSLNKARIGHYNSQNLENVPKEYLVKYFHKIEGKDLYRINASLKAMVQFIRHNFFSEEPPSRNFDMILCRNVIIYFTPASKDKLVNLFYNSLTDHGWLILGESEILFVTHLRYKFYLYNEEERIYRRERRKFQSKVDIERRKKWWYGYRSTRGEE